MSRVLREYINKMFTFVIIIVTGATTIAGMTFLALKLMGLYPDVSTKALGIFLVTCFIYLAFGIFLIKTSYTTDENGDKCIKPRMLTVMKIFIIVLESVQFNFIAYMIPSREFWAYGFFFVICASFLLDVKFTAIVAGEIGVSLVVSSFIYNSDTRLPVKDALFVPEVILRVVGSVLSLASIVLLVGLVNRYLVNMKKEEIEENERRVTSVLNAVQNIMSDLLKAGTVLSKISESEEEAVKTLTSSSKNLLEASNVLSGKADSSIANLNELNECGSKVSENVERVGATSSMLIKKSSENAETLDSLQKVNEEVIDSMNETSNVAEKLSDAVKGIDVTLKLIDDIAMQTKILSINATIEAARAGEAGKGFAVVAQEVGNLAQSTQKSLSEIHEVMGNVMKNVKDMTKFVRSSDEQLNRQNEYFAGVFANMHEMNDLLKQAVKDIENMSNVQYRQLDVIKHTVDIGEDIADGVRGQNKEFAGISQMAENNAVNAYRMKEQINSITQMAAQIDTLLNA